MAKDWGNKKCLACGGRGLAWQMEKVYFAGAHVIMGYLHKNKKCQSWTGESNAKPM